MFLKIIQLRIWISDFSANSASPKLLLSLLPPGLAVQHSRVMPGSFKGGMGWDLPERASDPSQEQGGGRAVIPGSRAVWANQHLLWRHLSDPINPSITHTHPSQGLVFIFLHFPSISKLFSLFYLYMGVSVCRHMAWLWIGIKEVFNSFHDDILISRVSEQFHFQYYRFVHSWDVCMNYCVSPQCCLQFVLTHFLLQMLKICYLCLFDMII